MTNENYTPYGEEWKKEMEKHPKKIIIEMFSKVGLLENKAINEIENAMERWHLARDNDNETLENINDILVEIGLLEFFNKK